MSSLWWRILIHSGPLLGINCPHPYLPISPHPLPPPWPILYYNDDINNFGLLVQEQSSLSTAGTGPRKHRMPHGNCRWTCCCTCRHMVLGKKGNGLRLPLSTLEQEHGWWQQLWSQYNSVSEWKDQGGTEGPSYLWDHIERRIHLDEWTDGRHNVLLWAACETKVGIVDGLEGTLYGSISR